jgi:hypothetical protein
MSLEPEAFFILRVVMFLKFTYALKALLADWQATEQLVGLLFPRATGFFSVLMIVVMLVGAFSLLFGFYGQIGGFLLFWFCLLGMRLHYILARTIENTELSGSASIEDKHRLVDVKALGVMAQDACVSKNAVIAAVALFFCLIGTGPYSLTCNLW